MSRNCRFPVKILTRHVTNVQNPTRPRNLQVRQTSRVRGREQIEEVVVLVSLVLGPLEDLLGLLDVVSDRFDELVERREVHLGPRVTQHDHLQDLAVEVVLERVDDVGLHGLLGVFVEGVPADAHDHFVHGITFHLRPAEVNAGLQAVREPLDNVQREVGRRDAKLLGSPAESLDHFARDEMRQRTFHAIVGYVPPVRQRAGRR